jgi:hypothetical protein
MGCRVIFSVPLKPAKSRLGLGWFRPHAAETDQQIEKLNLPPDLAGIENQKAQ